MKSFARVVGIYIAIIATTTAGCTPSTYADTRITCPLGKKLAIDTCQNYTSASDMQNFASEIYESLGEFAEVHHTPMPPKNDVYFITPDNAQISPCAMSPNEPYVACYTEGKLYIGSMMLYTNYTDTGALAPVTIIAHEYGHYLQNAGQSNGSRPNNGSSAVEIENQADCVSGAYVAWLGTKQHIKLSALVSLLAMIWDHGSNPYLELYKIHGTPQERTGAFTTGYDGGLNACNAIGNLAVAPS